MQEHNRHSPVRMFWKADSTLDASKADVSMNDRPFSAGCQLWNTVKVRYHIALASAPTRAAMNRITIILASCPARPPNPIRTRLTSESLCFLRWHRPQVLQIAFISHQHDDNVLIRVISQLFEPSLDVFVGLVLGNVVYEQCANSASVVSRGDGTVALLTS